MNSPYLAGKAGALLKEACPTCKGSGKVHVECAGCGKRLTDSSFIASDGYLYCADCTVERIDKGEIP
jgi:RecJ-like exonuclease